MRRRSFMERLSISSLPVLGWLMWNSPAKAPTEPAYIEPVRALRRAIDDAGAVIFDVFSAARALHRAQAFVDPFITTPPPAESLALMVLHNRKQEFTEFLADPKRVRGREWEVLDYLEDAWMTTGGPLTEAGAAKIAGALVEIEDAVKAVERSAPPPTVLTLTKRTQYHLKVTWADLRDRMP